MMVDGMVDRWRPIKLRPKYPIMAGTSKLRIEKILNDFRIKIKKILNRM